MVLSLLDRLKKKQQLQLLSSDFPPGLLFLMDSLDVLLQPLPSVGPGAVMQQVAAIPGVGPGEHKSKKGCSELHVKDLTL